MTTKVRFQYHNGAEKEFSLRDARALVRLGKGFIRADVAQHVHIRTNEPKALDEDDARRVVNNVVAVQHDDGLDALDKDALLKLAKLRNVLVHHASGADKIRVALRDSAAQQLDAGEV